MRVSGTPAATAGAALIRERPGAFKLGQREHDAIFGEADWQEFRRKIDDAIEGLRN